MMDVGRSLDALSGDALRHRHPEPGHPVEHRAADPGFGLLGRQSPGAKTTTDDSFVAEHSGLPERAPAVAGRTSRKGCTLARLQRICCLLFRRLATISLTALSTNAVEIGSPRRRRAA